MYFILVSLVSENWRFGFLYIFNCIFQYNIAQIIVSTDQGLLRGEQLWTITGNTFYNSFKGIPYARPPVGDLRFRDTQPATSWNGIRNATEHGNTCPQFNKLNNRLTPGSEDCLYLNVYAPSSQRHLIPVIFFIHGGDEFGSGNDDIYGPDFLIDRNVVLVTINYRIGTLGFLNLGSQKVPGNAGLKDQVAALRWVQRNIANFGGNPDQVTIFGESDGASHCTLHILSPMSKKLFKRVIAMTGVSISQYALEFESIRRAFQLGKNLGFESLNNSTALFNFLQNVSAIRLLDPHSSIIAAEQFIDFVQKVYFVPVVEKDFGQERFLIEPPEVSLSKGRTNNVKILLGYPTAIAVAVLRKYENLTDNTIKNYYKYQETLVPRSIYYQSTPKSVLVLSDLIKDYYFGSQPMTFKAMPQYISYFTDINVSDIIRYARQLFDYNTNNSIYLYQFSCMSERNILRRDGEKYGIAGVAYSDDYIYLFNANIYNLTLNKSSTSYRMIEQTCSLFTNFAKFGNPTPDSSLGVMWPQYDTQSETYLDIGKELTVGTKPKAKMMDFWKNIYCQTDVLF